MLSLNDIIKGKGFFGAIGQIGGLTLISRVLGFIRDVLIAIFVGAGPIADAFFVAFKLPNLFRGMTAEGALTKRPKKVTKRQLNSPLKRKQYCFGC